MSLQWLLDRFREREDDDAVVWRDQTCSYGDLLTKIEAAGRFLQDQGVESGEGVMLDADFSPNAIALLLAAMAHRTVVVPIASHVVNLDRERYRRIVEASWSISVSDDDSYHAARDPIEVTHELLRQVQSRKAPGLILFTSAMTGEPKAALHDLEVLLTRFQESRHSQRMITFLLFDHIGGFNTLMYTLANCGCVITLAARDPVSVCRAIQEHRAQVLPTSPTFLNLLLMSGAYTDFDLSSLKVINYATEVMPEATLARLNQALPDVNFHQSYGATELGIMRTKSRSTDSVWVRNAGEGYQTRVCDGVLHVKSRTSMLGYLNAPSPFTEDGWFDTEDEVEVDGEWFRIKGRKTDIINVGGEKVYPAEVESVILEVDNVENVTVGKEPHPITGNIVVADVQLGEPEEPAAVTQRIRKHCFSKLPSCKVPVKVRLFEQGEVTERFKKKRALDKTAAPD